MSEFSFNYEQSGHGDENVDRELLEKLQEAKRLHEEQAATEKGKKEEEMREAARSIVDQMGKEQAYGFILSQVLVDMMKANIVMLGATVLKDPDVDANEKRFAIEAVAGMLSHIEIITEMSMALWGDDMMDNMEVLAQALYEEDDDE